MDAGFGFAKLGEDGRGAFARLGCKLRFLKDFENRAEGAMFLLVLGLDLDIGSGHAVFPHFFGGELPTGDLQAAQFGAEVFDVAAGVHQSAERHVAANARKTIEISEFHGMPPCEEDFPLKNLSARYKLILSAQRRSVKRARRSSCL